MATITSLGVGSGLNAESIISATMAVERKPVTLVQGRIDSLQTKLSSIGKLKSLVATMRDKAALLAGPTPWGKLGVTTTDATAVTASAADGSAPGRYSVSVSALAASQTITSSALASSTSTLSEGTLTLQLGSYGSGTPPTSFTPKTGVNPVTISIGPGETSLSSIRDKINAAGAGVTATIINDASGARLSLRSTETGEVNGFTLTASETTDDGDSATGLSALGYDARSSSPMALNQKAANAAAVINGISVTSTTNTFSGVSDGLTLTVSKITPSNVEVVTAQDTSSIKTAIDDFVKAYNELATYIKDQTKVEQSTTSGSGAGNTGVSVKTGPLQGDRSVVDLQSQLRSMVNLPTTVSSTWKNLSQVGIAMKQDGTLETKSKEMTAALANPSELRKFFGTNGNDTLSSGFMDRFRDVGDKALSFDGSLETRNTYLQKDIARLNQNKTDMEDRLVQKEANLRTRYQQLDSQMSKLNALSSYVSQQMALINAN